MRGMIEGLPSPHPIRALLPAGTKLPDPASFQAARLERLVSRVVPAEMISKVEVSPA